VFGQLSPDYFDALRKAPRPPVGRVLPHGGCVGTSRDRKAPRHPVGRVPSPGERIGMPGPAASGHAAHNGNPERARDGLWPLVQWREAGVILCSGKGEALVRYATDTLPNKLLVREYLTALPDEKLLVAELEKTRKQLEPGR
jgi:hypothetical protein